MQILNNGILGWESIMVIVLHHLLLIKIIYSCYMHGMI